MKKIFFIILLLNILSLCGREGLLFAQDSYYYGFCDKDLARGEIQSLSAGKSNQKFFCYIHLSAEEATLLAGNKITSLYFSLGYCSATSILVDITEDVKGEPLYQQTGSCGMLKWNEVTLTTPYTIEAGKAVYIGYEVNQKYNFDAPVDVVKDNTYGNTEGDIIGKGTSKETADWSHSSENGYGNLCILAKIEGDNLPRHNVALTSVGLASFGSYVKTGKDFQVLCELKNIGLETITSLTGEYTLDDNSPVQFEETLSLSHDSISTFTLPSLQVSAEGKHSIKVDIKSVNGVDDQSPSDNSTSYSFDAYNNVVDRNVLIEMFTSQSCKNCDAGEEAVEKAMAVRSNTIYVAHHSGFADDKYTSDYDSKFTYFFPESGTFNPGVMFDRRNINAVTLQTDDAPVVFPYTNRVRDYIDYALSFPTFVDINIDNAYDPSTRNLTIDVQTIGETDDQAYLNVWLVEDGIVGAQTTSEGTINNEFVHNGVMRMSMTDQWGEAVENNVSKSYSCVVPEEYVADNLRIVAFLSKFSTSDNNACEVINAAQSKLTEVDGITEVQSSNIYNKVYNLNGQAVSYPQHGIYIVNGKTKIYR